MTPYGHARNYCAQCRRVGIATEAQGTGDLCDYHASQASAEVVPVEYYDEQKPRRDLIGVALAREAREAA